jgi:cysteine desulfurase
MNFSTSSTSIPSAAGVLKQGHAIDDCGCIYLDNAATTRLDSRVREAMNRIWCEDCFGNPHAKHHFYGSRAVEAVERGRKAVAASVGAEPCEIVFTSGATEANNLVIKGIANYLRSIGKTHVITTTIEHKSVLESINTLRLSGFTVTALSTKPCGLVTADMIKKALTPQTGLVSIQAVNNETGTVQPLAEIASMLSGRGILIHSDAAQALSKMPFDVKENGVDFATFSAHKIYGPQGIGALFVKKDHVNILEPLIAGGGQESGLRSGTLPVALCAGFGTACSLIADDRAYLQRLRLKFLDRVELLKPIVYGRRDPGGNVPGILNIRFPGIESEVLISVLPGVAFGVGSACSSTGTKLSHVIMSITGSEQAAKESIRLSFGRYTSESEVDSAASQIIGAVMAIRNLQED